jgi:hypothetical protein
VGRFSYPKGETALPPPLPPAERTVGQLVAESIRLYGDRFFRVLPLGAAIGLIDLAGFERGVVFQTVMLWAFGPLLAATYVAASALVAGVRLDRRTALTALVVGLIVFAPFPVLFRLYVLPGVALFGLLGLAVPAAVVERLGVRDALRRGWQLGRADPAHAIGGIATLCIVYWLSRSSLLFLLRTQGDQTQRAAGFVADLVMAPLLFLGPALLYFDQAARVRLGEPDRGGA